MAFGKPAYKFIIANYWTVESVAVGYIGRVLSVVPDTRFIGKIIM